MAKILVFLVAALVCAVYSLPLESFVSDIEIPSQSLTHELQTHNVRRRFVNPLFSMGTPDHGDISKIRTKRSEDECEKLQLCKLHARSRFNFFAAYELYFVNKENARLWDHHARSIADCEQRYGDCYNK